jgi:PIN domain nuclease of toxin-antitoxin system
VAAPPLALCIGISPAIAARTTELPSGFNRDPADRIIVATVLQLVRSLGGVTSVEELLKDDPPGV